MEQKPLVTVLMGSCNPRWDRLRRAVESLRGQTLTQWELVLWDDGSDSQGAMALEQAAALDSRVRLYHCRENHGLGYALNRCMERSHGTFLARLDDDDWCHPRRLERQVRFLQTHPAYGWVGCSARLVDRWGVWGVLTVPEEPGPRDFLPHSPYVHPGVMFRREVLESVGGYSQSPRHVGCEDYQLFFRLHAEGNRGYNLQTPPGGLPGGPGFLPPPGPCPPSPGGGGESLGIFPPGAAPAAQGSGSAASGCRLPGAGGSPPLGQAPGCVL